MARWERYYSIFVVIIVLVALAAIPFAAVAFLREGDVSELTRAAALIAIGVVFAVLVAMGVGRLTR